LRYPEVLCKWTFTNWCTNHDRHQQQQSRCLPLYNGIVSTNNICETIAPLAPQ
jgi:hypothetical protein